MNNISFFALAVFLLCGCASFIKTPAIKLNVEKLTPEHISEVKTLVAKLEPFIMTKDQEGKLPSLTFKELESPLNFREKRFLQSFRDLKATEIGVGIPFRGISQGEKDLVKLSGQKIRVKGKEKELPPQFLSPQVYQFYQFMMSAMERDIGKRLFVESGYRSSSHQLYLFIYYLSNHDYSIRETAKWVALPGYSEHGDPEHLAIDFINADGVNGEYNVPEFEALPEYHWLLKNAGHFGFVLSYPKNVPVGITYEPWHWRYDGAPKPQQTRIQPTPDKV
ncbi:MAG: D-alanyl-D-alanine carboxypeptidase family protein [Candidatus Omnitrophota bacterium]